MRDFLDFLHIQDEEVLSGTYYARLPITSQDAGEPFQYDIVDDNDKTYSLLLNNIQTEQSIQTIKTSDASGFKVKGYVVTQDGALWQITGIIKKLSNPDNKQALRILTETVESEYIIRLLQVDNPMGLK